MNTEEKKRLVVNYFLQNPYASINEISEYTNVPKSSCQRYLTSQTCSNILIPKTGKKISEQLYENRIKGNRKGGLTTFNNYHSTKDSSGNFSGLVKGNKDAEAIKRNDIIYIVTYFSNNPYSTLKEISDYFENRYTVDYIYDCLTDNRVEEIFGASIALNIKKELFNNRYGMLRKFEGNIEEILSDESDLEKREIDILKYRFNNGDIRSSEDTAKYFGITKTMVTKIENKVLDKINKGNKKYK